VENLIPVPDGISAENALFLPNMETAVSLVMDGQPVIGENVVVFGLGVVGLLVSGLLSRFPLRKLTTVDNYPFRCGKLPLMGDNIGNSPKFLEKTLDKKADLCYELTGNPEVLNQAINVTGYAGRIVVGSWYGQKQAPIRLGGTFHRSHIQIVASQVSQLHPRWRGRWDKARRFDTAWDMIRDLNPARLITHRFPLSAAGEAYYLLDQNPEETVQVIFTYT
jgi:threonine dehydrogenase-like Zn-dependent dehydrogenase